jgi:hypothetical protein
MARESFAPCSGLANGTAVTRVALVAPNDEDIVSSQVRTLELPARVAANGWRVKLSLEGNDGRS